MQISYVVMVAVAVGIVVGIMGLLVARWLRAMLSVTTAKSTMCPKRKSGRNGTQKQVKRKSDEHVDVGTVSADIPQKRRGRPAKVHAAVNPQPTAPVDAVKKRRGRPTKAEVAARQAAMAMEEKATTTTSNSSTMKPAITNQDHLLEIFLSLSPEQLHALASMPVGEASPPISKEGLTT